MGVPRLLVRPHAAVDAVRRGSHSPERDAILLPPDAAADSTAGFERREARGVGGELGG